MIDYNEIGNIESDDASWEVTNDEDEGKIKLSYFDVNKENDPVISITVTHEEFDDLVELINELQEKFFKAQ